MTPDQYSLRKILELEKRSGYQDKAVIGGLDRFLKRWREERVEPVNSVTNSTTTAGIDLLLNTSYSSLSKKERARWIYRILGSLKNQDKKSGETTEEKPPHLAIKRRTKGPENPPPAEGQSVDIPATAVRGISTSLAAKLKKLGILTVRDLLYFFPHRHLDYSQRKFISQIRMDEVETVVVNVWQAREVRLGSRRSTEAVVGDETGNVRVVWFNNPYMAKNLTTNTRIILSGKVAVFKGSFVFQSPEWERVGDEDLVHTGRLVPIYHLTSGIRPRQMRKTVKEAVDRWSELIKDFLPRRIKEQHSLLDLTTAIEQAHYPDDESSKDQARIRLAFDELFLLQLGVLSKRREWQNQPGKPLHTDNSTLGSFIASLPFDLTPAQHRVLKEITGDLELARPMSRLLQGEVGSGKTVVATAALLVAVGSDYQGTIMAPTEILAEQHFATIRNLLSRAGNENNTGEHIYSYSGIFPRPVSIALLTGYTGRQKKAKIKQYILDGEVDIVIGTHALIQKGISFQRLGLAVIDEQHRFGVAQRQAIRQKGYNPHVLVMTATPIPRTLALTLYGDLDLSVIDQLPPGRQVIKTKWLKPEQRKSGYAFLRREINEGRQAFILCPLVEESESVQAKAAVAEYEYLAREIFPEFNLGLLHGRMSSANKDSVMRHFHSGKLDILVSTPVIEVGIDVPNATVMMVESADRFGLSQLHQFRGRVGRGQNQSYCMLLANDPSKIGQARLSIIEEVHDGFRLAAEDLRLRGPGEFFGTRQSGIPDLKMARLSDVNLLERARNEATRLFEEDPEMEKPEHKPLAIELRRVWPTEPSERS